MSTVTARSSVTRNAAPTLHDRILVFIPMYNCARQIPRVLTRFRSCPSDLFEEILVVDNGSTDGSPEACAEIVKTWNGPRLTVVRNCENYNLGGSHKVAFNYAIDHGFDYVVVLHGDDQGQIDDVIEPLRRGDHRHVDCLLGSRFMSGAKRQGYAWHRTAGNLVFNSLFSLVGGKRVSDLGSGLNVYSTFYLRDRAWLRFPNALTFNYYLLLHALATNSELQFFPIQWREEDQVSNVRLVRQTRHMIGLLARFVTNRQRFLTAWHEAERDYRFEKLASSQPD